jgi:4'-phosphopantetheinyl transferase
VQAPGGRVREAGRVTVRAFAFGPLQCRWQASGPDRLAIARDWLDSLPCVGSSAPLQRDARARPRLPAGHGDVGWAHTREQLLLAYAPHGHVGVDVEAADRRVRVSELARRYFAPEETAGLLALHADTQQLAFLRLWCAKEAVLKAHGHGLAFGLHRLVFDPTSEAPRLLRCDPALGRPADWTLHGFAPAPGYLAVLAWHPGILPP